MGFASALIFSAVVPIGKLACVQQPSLAPAQHVQQPQQPQQHGGLVVASASPLSTAQLLQRANMEPPAAPAAPSAAGISSAGPAACGWPAAAHGRWEQVSEADDAHPTCCTWDASPAARARARALAAAAAAAAAAAGTAASAAPAWGRRAQGAAPLPQPACSLEHRIAIADGNVFAKAWGDDGSLMPSGGRGCWCSAARQRAIAAYAWRAAGGAACEAPAWDAAAFCAALAGRSLLFLGDSTSQQLAAAVHNYIVWRGGGCAAQVTAITADTLLQRDYGASNRGCMWLDCLRELPAPPGVLVLSAGAHVHSDAGMTEILTTVRDQFLAHRGDVLAGTQLVWATSLGGGCLVGSAPQTPRTVMPRDEPGYWEALAATQKVYNYADMELWDTQASDFWAGVPGAAVLDLTPLWLRPDAMVDSDKLMPHNCIHVCSPGPLRFAAQQLQRLLQLLPPTSSPPPPSSP